jgi:hypothetical protein
VNQRIKIIPVGSELSVISIVVAIVIVVEKTWNAEESTTITTTTITMGGGQVAFSARTETGQ